MTSLVLEAAAWFARVLPARVQRGLYRLGPLTRGVRRLLNAAAPHGLTEVDVAAGPLAGARLQLDLQTEKDLWLGTYEPDLMQAVRDFVQPGSIVYDVGANLGYVSLVLARAVGPAGRVTAFEPLPANFDRLRFNAALNREGEWIRIVQSAVGARAARGQLLVHASGGMGRLATSSGRPFVPVGSMEVQVITLDDWVYRKGEAPPALVKLDIEGGEAQALEGMPRLLRETRPHLLIELHGAEAAEAAQQALRAADYRLRAMRPGYPGWQPGLWKAYVVAIPDTPAGTTHMPGSSGTPR